MTNSLFIFYCSTIEVSMESFKCMCIIVFKRTLPQKDGSTCNSCFNKLVFSKLFTLTDHQLLKIGIEPGGDSSEDVDDAS